MNIGLLLLRLTVGLTLAAHGTQKLFGWFGGPGLNTTGQFFTVLGFPPGRRHALMAALSETVSGVLLAVGLATPAAMAVVVSVMLVAAVTTQQQGILRSKRRLRVRLRARRGRTNP
jgi:putative oxidoreductase